MDVDPRTAEVAPETGDSDMEPNRPSPGAGTTGLGMLGTGVSGVSGPFGARAGGQDRAGRGDGEVGLNSPRAERAFGDAQAGNPAVADDPTARALEPGGKAVPGSDAGSGGQTTPHSGTGLGNETGQNNGIAPRRETEPEDEAKPRGQTELSNDSELSGEAKSRASGHEAAADDPPTENQTEPSNDSDPSSETSSGAGDQKTPAGGSSAESQTELSNDSEPSSEAKSRASDHEAAAGDHEETVDGPSAERRADGGVVETAAAGPAAGSGEAAQAGGLEPAVGGELVPVLWSEASPFGTMLGEVPHWPVVTGRLHLALAVVLHTRLGAASVHYLTHEQIGEHSFDVLMVEACDRLAGNLRVDVEETPDGDLFSLSGTLVAAAVCVPAFYRLLAELADAERLLVGVVSPNLVYVAPDGQFDDMISELALGSEHEDTELVPCVVRVTGAGVEFVAERSTSSS